MGRVGSASGATATRRCAPARARWPDRMGVSERRNWHRAQQAVLPKAKHQ
jgi:hypothetical protein